ncbi:hypothetical protein [Nitrosomonas ureae]|uniref:Uncharacterized protein n=1 Tax=Nitrosomonas ureae TaxID=44577 RepID=A0A1H2ENH1_9PROT|nr:hypothetical protein [Nitrosomonas ureae]ALQ51915.1 hypothetical protein ATY38_12205 [Nitrosomonas ureae]SDT96641.1 hypothetical protein SAMN05216406_11427 [Nitrosomonas ureae]
MTKGVRRSERRPLAGGKRQNFIRQKFEFKDLEITVEDGAPGFGSAALFKLPEGNVLIHGAAGYVQLSSSDADLTATFDGDISIGTGSDADGSLSGSEINLVASTSLGAATSKVSPVVRLVSATASNGVIHDNTANDLQFYANVLIDDAAISGEVDLLLNGHMEVLYTVLGDD